MRTILRKCLLSGGIVLPSLLAGCTGGLHVDNCSSIPPGAIPAPSGTYVCKLQDTQAAKAEADDFVIYKYEWYLGGAELGPFGRYHITEIVNRLPYVPFPVIVEPHVDTEVTEARRQLIVTYLSRSGIPDPEQRVIVAFPNAEGIHGIEAELTFGRMIGDNLDNRGGSIYGNRARDYAPFGAGRGGFGGFRGGFRGGFGGGFTGF